MVKRRGPMRVKRQPTAEEIEAFASGADGENSKTEKTREAVLNPNANRDFKAIRVPFNEYEYSKLEEVAAKTGRTKLNVLRWSVLKFAENLEENTE